MSVVPDGWQVTTLGRLGRYINGRGFKKSEWGPLGRPIIRIQNLTGSSESFNYFDGVVDERNVARSGDLLVSWAATLGAYVWHGPEALVNQHIFKVESNIDVRFHKYLLDYSLDDLKRHTHGSGMVHITRPQFDALPVAIPDLDEQRRIVDLIESHLSHVDAANASLANASLKSASIVESWLDRAFSGLAHAEYSTVGSELLGIRGGWSRGRKHTVEADEGVPYLKMNNIEPRGGLRLDAVTHVCGEEAEIARYRLAPGDLLFNSKNSGDLVGKTAVADERVVGWTFNENIMRLRFRERVQPEFAAIWFYSPTFRDCVRAATRASTNVAAVYANALREFPMAVPSQAQQEEIVAEHREMVESVIRYRGVARCLGSQMKSFRSSLLRAAFTGRLSSATREPVRV